MQDGPENGRNRVGKPLDRAHERLSGPATQRILKREHAEFGHRKFTRSAEISVAHLYNLNVTYFGRR
jgi:hypothetical protein